MRIAYTLNGLVGGFSGKNTSNADKDTDSILILKYVSDLIQKHIVPYNNVDFFLFSWHTNFKDEFEKYLSPKKLKLVPQIDFNIPEHLKSGNIGRVIAHKSRWYGFKEVMNLVSEYETEFTATVAKDNIFGSQFHPEKSANAGIKVLSNFLSL